MPNSRAKGIRGELEVVKLMQRWYPGCKRSFGQARQGYEQPDIIGGGIEDDFFVEVKRYKKLTQKQLSNFWIKTKKDRSRFNNNLPASMIHREDKDDWFVWVQWINNMPSDIGGGMTWQEFSDAMDNWKGVK